MCVIRLILLSSRGSFNEMCLQNKYFFVGANKRVSCCLPSNCLLQKHNHALAAWAAGQLCFIPKDQCFKEKWRKNNPIFTSGYGSHICDFNPNTHSTVNSFSTPSLQGLKWAGKVWNGILTPSVNEQLTLTRRLMHIIHVYFFFKWQDISNGTFQIFQQISANTQTFLCSLSQSVSVS